MGRRKVTSDSDVLAATIQVISRLGPARLTLADVASEVGLSPATLLQRFGSKRGLLLAVAEAGTARIKDCFTHVRAIHRSPLAALMAGLDEFTGMAETPESLANSLAFLEIDLTDPDFHRLALAGSLETMAGYQALLDEAMKAGELVQCDTARLSRALSAICSGSMLTWAIIRKGTVREWVRKDIEMVLDPYRTQPRRSRRSLLPGNKLLAKGK